MLPTLPAALPQPGTSVRGRLAALREQLREHAPLPPLQGSDYGRAHLQFEARSDQRALLTSWVLDRLPASGALSVLSVGCGDGELDGQLARTVTGADPGRSVHWAGVEPSVSSAASFALRLAAFDVEQLTWQVDASTFEQHRGVPRFDVVTLVHCLYYVPDVLAALRKATDLLGPRGTVLVAHAPQPGLNELGALLDPHEHDRALHWSASTHRAVLAGGLSASPGRLEARVDLSVCRDLHDPVGRDVLDFTVQARLPDALRPAVLDVLEALSLPGTDLVVPHPVDTWVLHRSPLPGGTP